MAGLGEEIEGLDFGELVFLVSKQVLKIADLGGRVAGNIYNGRGGKSE